MLAGLVAGLAVLVVSSCAYDPYYSGGSYSSGGGYGNGYGYGNSSFSTSFFVGTGSPRWGYDPYAGAYYDYNRRCYYDPYLSGYYPVGYRPRYVYGAPHPHGWSRGYGSIAPPSSVRVYNLTNYQDRTSRYRGLGRDWSRNVTTAHAGRDQRSGHGGVFDSGRGRGDYAQGQDRGGRDGNPGSSGFNRGGSDFERSRGDRSSGSVFGGGSPSEVVPPQAPDLRGGGGIFQGRGGAAPDPGLRQQPFENMRESPAAPQIQPQPMPQPSRDDGRGGEDFRGGGGSPEPSGDGGDRPGRGVRGLGEG